MHIKKYIQQHNFVTNCNLNMLVQLLNIYFVLTRLLFIF